MRRTATAAAASLLLWAGACADSPSQEGCTRNEDFTQIRICGGACDEIQASPDAHVRITVGCATAVL